MEVIYKRNILNMPFEKYIHYFIIYLMVSLNGAFWFESKPDMVLYGILALYFILFIFNSKYRKHITIGISGFLLTCVLYVRLINNGGIGIDTWILWSGQILIVFIAYLFNEEEFVNRYVKFIFILAIISLIFWQVTLINPKMITNIFSPSEAYSYNGIFYGKWIYVYRTSLWDLGARNNGIFSEPGRYQTVLISCMYMLFFKREKINITDKMYYVFCIVIMITLISVGSTTGFIGLLILMVHYLIKSFNVNRFSINERKIRRIIVFIIFILAIFFLTDLYINQENSIYNTIIVNKINDTFKDQGSSGAARMGAMSIYIDTIMKNPWGVGYDKLTMALNNSIYSSNVAGAGMIRFVAAIGIIPSVIIISLGLYPFLINRNSYWIDYISFICIYINISLAQTYAFYPSLIIIPVMIYYEIKRRNNYKIKG